MPINQNFKCNKSLLRNTDNCDDIHKYENLNFNNIGRNNHNCLFKNELIQNRASIEKKHKYIDSYNTKSKYSCTISEESDSLEGSDYESDHWLKYLQDLEEEQELLKLETEILIRNRGALQDIANIKLL